MAGGRESPKKKKTGRPGYNFDEYVTQEIKDNIPKWKRQGQTDEWIAKNIGVGYAKLREWKKEFSAFSALFKKGKEDLMLELEETLYSRALGKNVEETETVTDGQGNVISVKSKTKHIWSDSNLQFALSRLDRKKWADAEREEFRKEIELLRLELQANNSKK